MIYISYVAPCSTVKIYGGIKLEKSYQHTIYFDSVANQTAFFENITPIFTLTKSQYTRASKNSIKVQANVNNLLTANYMRFYNPRPNSTSPTSGKWFYAFVDSVEYVAETVTEIFYTIDVMQTWFVGCSVPSGYVERAHINGDSGLYNYVPEPFSIEKKVVNGEVFYQNFEMGYMVTATQRLGGEDDKDTFTFGLALYSGVPNAVRNIIYRGTGQLDADLLKYLGFADSAVAQLSLVPIDFMGEDNVDGWNGKAMITVPITKPFTTVVSPTSINGYTPMNAKLFTSQFNRLILTNLRGEKITLLPELFNGEISIDIVFSPSIFPEITAMVKNYGGDNILTKTQYAISINEHPTGLVATDRYANWLQTQLNSFQNKTTFSALNSVMSGIGGALNPNTSGAQKIFGGVQAGIGVAETITGALATQADMQASPDHVSGKSSGSPFLSGYTINNIKPLNGFLAYFESIDARNAEIVDNFLSRYGYAIKNMVATVITNRNTPKYRKHFYYIQMRDAIIDGSIPCEEERKICDILNRGITFWNKNSNSIIGDYSLATLLANKPQATAQPW